MRGKYKGVSVYNQPIRKKLNARRVKRVLEVRSSIEESFSNNCSLHHSPIKCFNFPKEEHTVLKVQSRQSIPTWMPTMQRVRKNRVEGVPVLREYTEVVE